MSFRLLDERDINAIKGNLKGEVVRADDVLPAEHKVKVNVCSKNLYGFSGRSVQDFGGYDSSSKRSFKGNSIYTGISASNYYDPDKCSYTYDETTNQMTVTTLKAWYGVGIDIKVKPNTTYFVSGNIPDTCFVSISQFDKDGSLITNQHCKDNTFTTDSITVWVLAILSCQIADTTYTFSNIQIEEGEIATDYTPYVDPASVKVSRCGKNLFDISKHIKKTATSNGITVDVLDDGCIYVHGTPIDTTTSTTVTLSHSQEVDVFPKGTYVYSNNPIIDDANVYCFPQANKPTNKAWLLNINKTATEVPEEFCMDRFVVYVKEGITNAVNAKFYLQVEAGEESSKYEKYKDILTFTPNADGSCDVKTTSPSMTLLTDKEGITIECEYNKDANKVIEKLTNAIIALGGTV